MIRSLYRTQDGQVRTDLTADEFAAALQDVHGLLWVDLSCESPETCEPILRQTFGFHPLAVDDALEEAHVPKVDDWDEYLYVALHAVVFNGQDDEPVDARELDVFLGRNLSWLLFPSAESGGEDRGVLMRAWTLSATAPQVDN